MMQVSTLYAHSLERQLVSRRTQIIQNLSRSCSSVDQQSTHQQQETATNNGVDAQTLAGELFLTEAGIIPPELQEVTPYSSNTLSNNNNNNHESCPNISLMESKQGGVDIDAKEFTDRLCKLPSQCKGGYILGSPRRHSSAMNGSATRLCQSAGHLNVSPDILKSQCTKKIGTMSASGASSGGGESKSSLFGGGDKKNPKKSKGKDKKDAKKLPSNFMYLGAWYTRQNCDKLLEQMKSGDVLEFNIKFHHHWGIALVNKNKKPTLENLELIHLKQEKDGTQRAVKQILAEYWIEGVTARINNSRDVHKQPSSAADVISTSLKMVSQPYRIWQNSEQLITYCRYGEGAARSRQLSDAARWGTLSKCVGLWLSLTSSRHSTPASSPAVRRKRTCSVNF